MLLAYWRKNFFVFQTFKIGFSRCYINYRTFKNLNTQLCMYFLVNTNAISINHLVCKESRFDFILVSIGFGFVCVFFSFTLSVSSNVD